LHPIFTEDDFSYLGRSTPREEEIIDELYGEAHSLQSQLATNAALSSDNKKAVVWLLDKMRSFIPQVDPIYQKWEDRKLGSFPLSRGDQPTDFDPACNGKVGQWVVVTNLQGNPVNVWCPNSAELMSRQVDRRTIIELLVSAAAHLRCAQWSYWRITLYKKALATAPKAPGGSWDPGGGTGGPKRELLFKPGGKFGGLAATPDPTDPYPQPTNDAGPTPGVPPQPMDPQAPPGVDPDPIPPAPHDAPLPLPDSDGGFEGGDTVEPTERSWGLALAGALGFLAMLIWSRR
jgi:hypothetical protein